MRCICRIVSLGVVGNRVSNWGTGWGTEVLIITCGKLMRFLLGSPDLVQFDLRITQAVVDHGVF